MHWLLTGQLQVDRLELPIADLPAHLNGTKLVQLSDFHWDGLRLSQALLEEAISASNREVPDLIVLTGDFVTTDPEPIHELTQYLKRLQSRHGIYAILGNHDLYYRSSRSRITQALEQAGIPVLWNQIVYPLGKPLALVGLAEFRSPDFHPDRLLPTLPSTHPRIVLSHNPETARILQAWRVDLQLSGHTHGGQLVIPGLGNLAALASKGYRRIPHRLMQVCPWLKAYRRLLKNWDWASGLHPVGSNLLYVNRGLGTYLPGRLFCPPEVTVFTLRSQPTLGRSIP